MLGVTLLIIFVAVVNFAIGFYIAVHFKYSAPTMIEAIDILAGGRPTGGGAPGLDALEQFPREVDAFEQGAFEEMLDGLVAADITEMLDDRSDEAEEVTPEEEPYDEDIAELLAPNQPEHWFLNEKYVETSILKLNIAMIKSGRRATDIDTTLRSAGESIDEDTLQICIDQLLEDCESFLQEQEEAAAKIRDRLDEFGELASLAEDIEMANLEQGAQVETTINNLHNMDFTSDPKGGCGRLLNELSKLRLARHTLRDRQEAAFITVARYEDRIGQVDEMLYNDELTSIKNRIGVEAALYHWWKQGRHKSRQIAIALLDLNDFGRINEEYGSHVGDLIISKVAAEWADQFGSSDIFGRFAGQSFIAATIDTGYRNTLKTVETLRQQIEKAVFVVDGTQIQLTANAAVTEATPDVGDEELIQRLEATLAAAKKHGKNCMFSLDPKGLDPEPELCESPSFVSDIKTFNLR